MQLTILYSHKTRIGIFHIARSDDGRFHPVFKDESLGSYATPEMAAEDLAGGSTFSIAEVPDTSTLGIPNELPEWNSVRKP